MDTSFEEYVKGNNNVLALVVSDNEDDYDSSVDSVSDNTITTEVEQPIESSPIPKPTVVIPKLRVNDREKSSSSKRWSFISNHSSSSLKRWSMLSSIPSEPSNRSVSGPKDASKRLSSASNFSVDSMGLDNVAKRHTSSDKNSIPSLKRSSTGMSLRHLLNKIVPDDSDKASSINSEKENILVNKETVTPMKSSSNRVPLRTVTNEHTAHRSKSRMSLNKSRHSVHFNPANTDETTVSSRLSKSSSITSLSSKLKFWKRNSVISSSASSRSLRISEPTDFTVMDSSMRTKTSFSDLHKSMYSSQHYITSFPQETPEINRYVKEHPQSRLNPVLLNKKKSGSSLSINNGLKHFSSSSSLSLGGIKNKSSHSSMNVKHKASHSSLHKLQKNRRKSNNGDDRSSISSNTASSINTNYQISLPVPDQVSREKIRNKLKNSTSLLSLNSSIPVFKKEFDESLLQEILTYCDSQQVIDNLRYTDDEIIGILKSLGSASKISNNVWKSDKVGPLSEKNVIFKKIDLGSLDDITYSKKATALHELKVHKYTSDIPGLTKLLRAYVVTSEIANPAGMDNDDLNSLYLILVMRDHGIALSSLVPIDNWRISATLFWNTVAVLANVEQKLQFEHRNLLLDHILVNPMDYSVTLCGLKSSRFQQDDMNTIAFTRLDDPIFFQRNATDNQYDLYSTMRLYLSENSGGQTNTNHPVCAKFEPRSNLLWLHNLSRRLLTETDDSKNQVIKEQMFKINSLIDPTLLSRRSMLKRPENDIKNVSDVLRWKKN
ncbi:protein kinase ALK1 RNJ42_02627 [Nakaseomyces bracarensis]|uniref:protein kinase ALK1 n=1 Tax=Nakaseomyces bracarensis TaxID=273131 RepID=UPI003871CCEA